jgi:hypothetical protein
MKDAMDVRLGWGFWTINILLGPLTLGILPIAMVLQARSWPRRLEDQHLILRNGLRIPWSECTNVVKQPMGRYEVVFGGTTVQVPTISLAGGKKVAQWILDRLHISFNK